MKQIIIYYRPPAYWAKLRIVKIEKWFYFIFRKGSINGFHLRFHTPIFHFYKDNANLFFGPSFGKWEASIHFHW
jgi:hypothetical protein